MIPNIINQNTDYPPINPDIVLELFNAFRKKENGLQNNDEINNATQQLVFYRTNSPSELMAICANFLLLNELDLPIYRFSTIIINNILKLTLNRDIKIHDDIPAFWANLDNSLKVTIQRGVLAGIMIDDKVSRNCSSEAISLITRLESLSATASTLFDTIFQILSSDQYSIGAKLGGIRVLGDIFELNHTHGPFLNERFNLPQIGENVFSLTITILQSEGTPLDFKVEAAKTLKSALPIFYTFVVSQFVELLKVFLSILPIGIHGYNLLLKFTKCFYPQLTSEVLVNIFNAVIADMTSSDEAKQLISIGFCYRFAKFEYKLARKIDNQIPILNITKQLSDQISPTLLQILLNSLDENMIDVFDDNPKENISNSIITTLTQFARFEDNQEAISKTILLFFTQQSQINQWNTKYASIYSLFVIVFIERNESITSFFMQLLPKLFEIISNESSESIQCIAILLIGQIVTHHFKTVLDQHAMETIVPLTVQLIQNQNTNISLAALFIVQNITTIIPQRLSNPQQFLNFFYRNICPVILTCYDRPDVFTGGYLDRVWETFRALIFHGPSYMNENFELIVMPLVELAKKLDLALTNQFPDENSAITMIGALTLAFQPIFLRFPPLDESINDQPIGQLILHLIEVFLKLVSSPNEIAALNAISTLVFCRIGSLVFNSIEAIFQVLRQCYTTSQSPEVLQFAATILGDIILKYPSKIEPDVAMLLFQTSVRYFKESYLVSYQIRVFQLIGDLLSVIPDPECVLADEILQGLKTVQSLVIPKIELETKSLQLRTILHVSKRFILSYQHNPQLIKRNKSLLFFAVLSISKTGYQQDADLLRSFLDFIDCILTQDDDIANIFCTFIQRDDIIQTIRNIQVFSLKGISASILRKLQVRYGKGYSRTPKIRRGG